MKKFFLALTLVAAIGGGCTVSTSSTSTNDIETSTYKLPVPDSATVIQIPGGYRIQNYAGDATDETSYAVIVTTNAASGSTIDSVEEFTATYPDATETTLGLNDGSVWSATGYDSGDGVWAEDAYYHEASNTLIIENYLEADGLLLAELVVNAITWK